MELPGPFAFYIFLLQSRARWELGLQGVLARKSLLRGWLDTLCDWYNQIKEDEIVFQTQYIEGAYLCLHCIPPAAVVEKRTPVQVEEGASSNMIQKGSVWPILDRENRIARHLEEKDIYDYLGEYGNDDSDHEMLQENYNTIFDNNIDSWCFRD